MNKLCTGCKKPKKLVAVDESTGIGFCADCSKWQVPPIEEIAVEYLQATVPFTEGDLVECRTAGVFYDGIGTVIGVSTDLKDGGTPVFPSFHVRIDEKAYPEVPDTLHYTEVCLKKVKQHA